MTTWRRAKHFGRKVIRTREVGRFYGIPLWQAAWLYWVAWPVQDMWIALRWWRYLRPLRKQGDKR